MPDARCTRDLMRNVHKECAHEHTGQRRTSDIPCAMALRLMARSPRWAVLFVTVPPRMLSPSRNLTPSSGRQDHTHLPYASAALVRQQHRRPSHPRPTFVAIASAPLVGTG